MNNIKNDNIENIISSVSSIINDFISFFELKQISEKPKINMIETNKEEQIEEKINDKVATYNFYNIFSSRMQLPYCGYIHYVMNGKENDPNITVTEKLESVRYVSKNLYIFSKIHQFTDIGDFQGELVIETTPVSKSNKKLYVCFPLKTNTTYCSKQTIIDVIIQNEDATNIDINLNSIIPLQSSAIYYETPYCKVIVVQNPINIQSQLTGFSKGKITDLFEVPAEIQTIDCAKNMNTFEPSTLYKLNGLSSTNTFVNAKECTLPNINLTKNDLPIDEELDELDKKYNELKEGFKEGITTSPNQYLECDYVNVDYNDETPTYRIAAGSDKITAREKSLNWGVSILWLIVIIAGVFIAGPLLFTILATRSFGANDDKLLYINGAEAVIFWLFFIPAIILTSMGTDQHFKCKSDDDKCIDKANQLLVPGIILLGITIFYVLSNMFNKLTNPNFLGYYDPPTNLNPIFKFDPKHVGILHFFNPVQAVVSLINVIYNSSKS